MSPTPSEPRPAANPGASLLRPFRLHLPELPRADVDDIGLTLDCGHDPIDLDTKLARLAEFVE
jgi:hypothetical protein